MVVEFRIENLDKFVRYAENLRFNIRRCQKDIRHEFAKDFLRNAKRLINLGRYHKSGSLSRDLKIFWHDDKVTVVGSSLPYAGMVDEGTVAHEQRFIRGSKGARMGFGWRGNKPRFEGNYVIHTHPGSKSARPTLNFSGKSMDRSVENLPSIVKKYFERAVRTK